MLERRFELSLSSLALSSNMPTLTPSLPAEVDLAI